MPQACLPERLLERLYEVQDDEYMHPAAMLYTSVNVENQLHIRATGRP